MAFFPSFSIIRGTTPTITTRISDDIPLYQVNELWFSIRQKENLIVDRVLTNGTVRIEGQFVIMDLSQAETLQFDPRFYAEVGIRMRMQNNALAASVPVYARIIDVVKEGII